MQPEFSEDLVKRTFEQAEAFAAVVVPMAQEAFRFSVTQVQLTPDGGADDLQANLQALPSLFRLNFIKMIKGHFRSNSHPPLRRKGSPNNGLWLGVAESDLMARVYKVSKKHRVRPSGYFQERLITQERFKSLRDQNPLFDDEQPVLDALLMWQSRNFELERVFLVIPDGWDAEGKLNVVATRELELPENLELVATFDGAMEDLPIIEGDMTILGSGVRHGKEFEAGEDHEYEEADFEVKFVSSEEELSETVREAGEDQENQ